MSRQDKVQLTVIYSIVAFLAVLSLLVWSGVFGQPKYTKDAQTAPNWFTNAHDDYDPTIQLVGSADQSSEFSGNLIGNYNLATESYYGVDGVRQDVGNSTTSIPSY